MSLFCRPALSTKTLNIRILAIFLVLSTSALLLLALGVLLMPRGLIKYRVCSMSLSRSLQSSLFSDVCLSSNSDSALHRAVSGIRPLDLEIPEEANYAGVDITRLGSTSIHVVSLARRTDRRRIMDMLKGVLDIDWTYFDALDKNDPLVDGIMNWVAKQRADASDVFVWPDMLDEDRLDDLGVYLAPQTHIAAHGSLSGFEALSGTSKLGNSSSSVSNSATPLVCATGDDSIPSYANVSSIPFHMRLSRGMIACWYSHVRLIADIVRHTALISITNTTDTSAITTGNGEEEVWNGLDGVTIVFEDDVDVEWDLKERIARMWVDLPKAWDIIMLGHCWSNESTYPAITPTSPLHPSHKPKCTHGYILSPSGARRLLQHLTYPPFAFSRALDQAIAHLVQTGRIRSFSVVPSIVVQRRCPPQTKIVDGVGDGNMTRDECRYFDSADGDSDIWVNGGRKGSRWRDSLADGALGRVWKGQMQLLN